MKKSSPKSDPLVGLWRSADDLGSTVDYRVAKTKGGYSVIARDSSDGELADVFEERWDAATGTFSFATHWNSTGRFMRCRLVLTSKNQVALTYTYTDTATLVRAADETRAKPGSRQSPTSAP